MIVDNFQENSMSVYEELADKYGLTIIDAETNAKNNGPNPNQMASAGSTIFFNYFDDPDIELVAFFHELGHVEISRSLLFNKNSFSFCKISQEALAWEFGLAIAAKEGYHWDYNSKQLEYARDCLMSYINYEGPFGGFK